MKSDMHKRLISFVVAEVLLQLGFERTSSHSLLILTDLFIKHIESLCLRIQPFQEIPSNLIVKFVLESLYGESEYENTELRQFACQQILFKQQLKEKNNPDEPESLLHLLKIIPKHAILESAFKNTKNLCLNGNKDSTPINDEINTDGFFTKFVSDMSAQSSHKPKLDYSLSLTESIASQIQNPSQLHNIDNTADTTLSLISDYEILLDSPISNNKLY